VLQRSSVFPTVRGFAGVLAFRHGAPCSFQIAFGSYTPSVMGNKEFFAPLSEHDRLRYRIVTERGDVVDFVVQYETLVGDEYRPVVRYDGSHGHGHRDSASRTRSEKQNVTCNCIGVSTATAS